MRPHDFEIDTQPTGKEGFRAMVQHVNAAGPQVKLELLSDSGETVRVAIPQERYRELDIARGARVFVSPREVKVFVHDYSI